MKKSLFSLLCTISLIGFSQNLTKIDHFGQNKGNLKMYTYVPENLDLNNRTPLVFVLHGCTQSAEQIALETGWNKLADSLHFIVVYPEQKQINNATKCFNFFIGFKAKKDKGEVASIRQMIDYCFENYQIDSSQIFITGMSAGGGMTNAMLNAYPNVFNAGAIVAGPSTLFDANNTSSEKQPRIAILQGDADKIVIPNNANKILDHWLTKHRIEKNNVDTINDYQKHAQLTVHLFRNTDQETKVIVLTEKGIAHKILINPGEKLNEGGAMDFHTEDINFHSTFWIAQFFGLTPKKD